METPLGSLLRSNRHLDRLIKVVDSMESYDKPIPNTTVMLINHIEATLMLINGLELAEVLKSTGN